MFEKSFLLFSPFSFPLQTILTNPKLFPRTREREIRSNQIHHGIKNLLVDPRVNTASHYYRCYDTYNDHCLFNDFTKQLWMALKTRLMIFAIKCISVNVICLQFCPHADQTSHSTKLKNIKSHRFEIKLSFQCCFGKENKAWMNGVFLKSKDVFVSIQC